MFPNSLVSEDRSSNTDLPGTGTWIIDENPPPLHPNDGLWQAYIDLLLKPSEDDLKIWPHSFEFRLRVNLTADGNLSLISRIRNINCKPFSFSIAYHTYFSISDISEVRVEGLETLDYLDNLYQRERFTEQGDALTFESEVDRVYLGSRDAIAIFDHERKRTFFIKKKAFQMLVFGIHGRRNLKPWLILGMRNTNRCFV
ncbi:hypothetical protein ES319_1Z021200v1 [Gossypium barbadense]|uniref:Aldose 1-epimerase n=1 Tax=Gossypium barbadense TaxID=3634 RepID=A0A5J5NBC7_GOSBA|nr:hypothetical protein ES319_1Z021200v1 [Gossypium barbadense]